MTDAVRTLAVACGLAATAGLLFTRHLRRLEPHSPARRVAELRAANTAALVVAAMGASTIGFALAHTDAATAALEIALAFLVIGAAGVMLLRDPSEALLIGAATLLAHAVIDLAHQPGGLDPDTMPRWWLIGGAVMDTYVAALCVLCRGRK